MSVKTFHSTCEANMYILLRMFVCFGILIFSNATSSFETGICYLISNVLYGKILGNTDIEGRSYICLLWPLLAEYMNRSFANCRIKTHLRYLLLVNMGPTLYGVTMVKTSDLIVRTLGNEAWRGYSNVKSSKCRALGSFLHFRSEQKQQAPPNFFGK